MSNKEQLSNLFVENWTSVFNTILGKDVKVTIEPIETIKTSDILGRSNDYDSFVSMSYGAKDSEKIIFLTKNKLISIVSNLMIGLDSFSNEINEDDMDAFSEGLNQMFASCQVPIKENLGLDMKFQGVTFIEKNEIPDLFSGDEVNLWVASVELPDISTEEFVLVSPVGFGETEQEIEEEDDEVSVSTSGNIVNENEGSQPSNYGGSNIDLILDVELPITIRIGSTEKKLVEIMRLGLGSIIELEKVVDDPVDVLVNNKLVAKGEVVVLDSNFAIRIIEVESKANRIQSLT